MGVAGIVVRLAIRLEGVPLVSKCTRNGSVNWAVEVVVLLVIRGLATLVFCTFSLGVGVGRGGSCLGGLGYN